MRWIPRIGRILALFAVGSRVAAAAVPVMPTPVVDNAWRGVREELAGATLPAAVRDTLDAAIARGEPWEVLVRMAYGTIPAEYRGALDQYWLSQPGIQTDLVAFRAFVEARAKVVDGAWLTQDEILSKWLHRAAANSGQYDNGGGNGIGGGVGGGQGGNRGRG